MIKPPFACARLCNPNIEDTERRGFIAPAPGSELQKCVPKQINVDRSETDKVDGKFKVFEAQILVGAALNQNTSGQQWNVYNEAGKREDVDHLMIGVDNDDLIPAVQSFKEEIRAACEQWLPGNTNFFHNAMSHKNFMQIRHQYYNFIII